MRIFECSSCHHAVFFESVRCVHCGAVLAYEFDRGEILSIEPIDVPDEHTDGDKQPTITYRDLSGGEARYKLCANSADHGVCNAALDADSEQELCVACRLNTVVPDLEAPSALEAWRSIEVAKRRLLYTLRALGLPLGAEGDSLPLKLTFSFLSDSPDGSTKVLTGHDAGHITLNVAEANAPFREKLRVELGEGYRTLLGHFRHEIGHFYWDALIKEGPWLAAFRKLFGDEQRDYGEALKQHYESGPPFKWHERYVSAYATMHPWEDWAETWAHYLHIVDTLDTARSHGVSIEAGVTKDLNTLSTKPSAIRPRHFPDLLAAWVPLTVTLNSLNRSMGLNDPYPFVLSEVIALKLHFVHDVIHSVSASAEERETLASRWLESADFYGEEGSLLPGSRNISQQQREPDATLVERATSSPEFVDSDTNAESGENRGPDGSAAGPGSPAPGSPAPGTPAPGTPEPEPDSPEPDPDSPEAPYNRAWAKGDDASNHAGSAPTPAAPNDEPPQKDTGSAPTLAVAS